MVTTLDTVQYPQEIRDKLRVAITREKRVREGAFLGGQQVVAGVEVNQLSLRVLLLLEAAGNGMVVPCAFDDNTEAVAHATQVLWFCSEFVAPTGAVLPSFWQRVLGNIKQQRFIERVLKLNPDRVALFREVEDWLADAFLDAPGGKANAAVVRRPDVAYAAAVIDLFAEAGLGYTHAEIMDMPLAQLWQHWKLATQRLHGVGSGSPSDIIETDYIQTLNEKKTA